MSSPPLHRKDLNDPYLEEDPLASREDQIHSLLQQLDQIRLLYTQEHAFGRNLRDYVLQKQLQSEQSSQSYDAIVACSITLARNHSTFPQLVHAIESLVCQHLKVLNVRMFLRTSTSSILSTFAPHSPQRLDYEIASISSVATRCIAERSTQVLQTHSSDYNPEIDLPFGSNQHFLLALPIFQHTPSSSSITGVLECVVEDIEHWESPQVVKFFQLFRILVSDAIANCVYLDQMKHQTAEYKHQLGVLEEEIEHHEQFNGISSLETIFKVVQTWQFRDNAPQQMQVYLIDQKKQEFWTIANANTLHIPFSCAGLVYDVFTQAKPYVHPLRTEAAFPIEDDEARILGILQIFRESSSENETKCIWTPSAVAQILRFSSHLCRAIHCQYQQTNAFESLKLARSCLQDIQMWIKDQNEVITRWHEPFLRLLSSKIKALVNADAGYAIMIDQDMTNRLLTCRTQEDSSELKSIFRTKGSYLEQVFLTGESIRRDKRIPSYDLSPELMDVDFPTIEALVLVPLHMQEELVGALAALNFSSNSVFSVQDENLLNEFSYQLGQLLHSQQVFHSQVDEIQAIDKIPNLFQFLQEWIQNYNHDLETGIQDLQEKLRQSWQTRQVAIYFCKTSSARQPKLWYNLHSPRQMCQLPKLVQMAIESKQIQYAKDWITIPLVCASQVIGCIECQCQDIATLLKWLELHGDFIQLIATMVRLCIDSELVVVSSENSMRQAYQHHFHLFQEIGERLMTCETIADLCLNCCNFADLLLLGRKEARMIHLYIYSIEEDDLMTWYMEDEVEHQLWIEKNSKRAKQSLVVQCLHQTQFLTMQNTSSMPPQHHIALLHPTNLIQSIVCLPLSTTEDKVWGILEIAQSVNEAFPPSEIQLFECIANLLALSYHRIRGLEQMVEKSKEQLARVHLEHKHARALESQEFQTAFENQQTSFDQIGVIMDKLTSLFLHASCTIAFEAEDSIWELLAQVNLTVKHSKVFGNEIGIWIYNSDDQTFDSAIFSNDRLRNGEKTWMKLTKQASEPIFKQVLQAQMIGIDEVQLKAIALPLLSPDKTIIGVALLQDPQSFDCLENQKNSKFIQALVDFLSLHLPIIQNHFNRVLISTLQEQQERSAQDQRYQTLQTQHTQVTGFYQKLIAFQQEHAQDSDFPTFCQAFVQHCHKMTEKHLHFGCSALGDLKVPQDVETQIQKTVAFSIDSTRQILTSAIATPSDAHEINGIVYMYLDEELRSTRTISTLEQQMFQFSCLMLEFEFAVGYYSSERQETQIKLQAQERELLEYQEQVHDFQQAALASEDRFHQFQTFCHEFFHHLQQQPHSIDHDLHFRLQDISTILTALHLPELLFCEAIRLITCTVAKTKTLESMQLYRPEMPVEEIKHMSSVVEQVVCKYLAQRKSGPSSFIESIDHDEHYSKLIDGPNTKNMLLMYLRNQHDQVIGFLQAVNFKAKQNHITDELEFVKSIICPAVEFVMEFCCLKQRLTLHHQDQHEILQTHIESHATQLNQYQTQEEHYSKQFQLIQASLHEFHHSSFSNLQSLFLNRLHELCSSVFCTGLFYLEDTTWMNLTTSTAPANPIEVQWINYLIQLSKEIKDAPVHISSCQFERLQHQFEWVKALSGSVFPSQDGSIALKSVVGIAVESCICICYSSADFAPELIELIDWIARIFLHVYRQQLLEQKRESQHQKQMAQHQEQVSHHQTQHQQLDKELQVISLSLSLLHEYFQYQTPSELISWFTKTTHSHLTTLTNSRACSIYISKPEGMMERLGASSEIALPPRSTVGQVFRKGETWNLTNSMVVDESTGDIYSNGLYVILHGASAEEKRSADNKIGVVCLMGKEIKYSEEEVALVKSYLQVAGFVILAIDQFTQQVRAIEEMQCQQTESQNQLKAVHLQSLYQQHYTNATPSPTKFHFSSNDIPVLTDDISFETTNLLPSLKTLLQASTPSELTASFYHVFQSIHPAFKCLRIYSIDQQQLCLLHSSDGKETHRYQLDQGMSGCVALTGQPQISTSAQPNSFYNEDIDGKCHDLETGCLACFPLFTNGQGSDVESVFCFSIQASNSVYEEKLVPFLVNFLEFYHTLSRHLLQTQNHLTQKEKVIQEQQERLEDQISTLQLQLHESNELTQLNQHSITTVFEEMAEFISSTKTPPNSTLLEKLFASLPEGKECTYSLTIYLAEESTQVFHCLTLSSFHEQRTNLIELVQHLTQYEKVCPFAMLKQTNPMIWKAYDSSQTVKFKSAEGQHVAVALTFPSMLHPLNGIVLESVVNEPQDLAIPTEVLKFLGYFVFICRSDQLKIESIHLEFQQMYETIENQVAKYISNTFPAFLEKDGLEDPEVISLLEKELNECVQVRESVIFSLKNQHFGVYEADGQFHPSSDINLPRITSFKTTQSFDTKTKRYYYFYLQPSRILRLSTSLQEHLTLHQHQLLSHLTHYINLFLRFHHKSSTQQNELQLHQQQVTHLERQQQLQHTTQEELDQQYKFISTLHQAIQQLLQQTHFQPLYQLLKTTLSYYILGNSIRVHFQMVSCIHVAFGNFISSTSCHCHEYSLTLQCVTRKPR